MSDIFIFIIVRNKNKTIKIKPDEVINKYLDSWMISISTKYGLNLNNLWDKLIINLKYLLWIQQKSLLYLLIMCMK